MAGLGMEERTAKGAGAQAGTVVAGYALFLVWFEGTKSFHIADVASNSFAAFSLCTMVADFVLLIAMGCLYRRIVSLRNRRGAMALSAALVAVSTVALLAPYAGAPLSPVAGGLFGVLAGVARAVLTLAWMEVFCGFDMRNACLLFASSTCVGTLAGTLLTFVLPDWACDALNALAGIASALLVVKVGGRALPASDATGAEAGPAARDIGGRPVVERWSFPVKPTLLMAVFAVTTLLVSNVAAPVQSFPVPRGTHSAIVALVLLLMARLWERFDIRVLSSLAAPFACVGLLGALSVFSAYPVPAPFAASMGYYCFSTFMCVLLFNIAFRFGANPLWLFGFSRAPRVAAAILVPLTVDGGFLVPASLATDVVLGIMVVILVGASSLLVTGRSFDTTWGIRPLGESEGDAVDHAAEALSVEERCDRAAWLYGLTKREEEVLALLARGMSTPEIERELHISNGTARNHIQHVYKKLDVHSRDEVERLLSSESFETPPAQKVHGRA